MKDTLGVLLAGGAGERLFPLTRDRAKPAVPFGGNYRIIDITLSNCLNSDLPESGTVYQKGLAKLDGKVLKAKLRYRGDSLNHWSLPYKSWRVNLTGAHMWRGMEVFNLYLPRTPSQLSDVMGYEPSFSPVTGLRFSVVGPVWPPLPLPFVCVLGVLIAVSICRGRRGRDEHAQSRAAFPADAPWRDTGDSIHRRPRAFAP